MLNLEIANKTLTLLSPLKSGDFAARTRVQKMTQTSRKAQRRQDKVLNSAQRRHAQDSISNSPVARVRVSLYLHSRVLAGAVLPIKVFSKHLCG